MKTKIHNILLVLSLVMVFLSCAKRGSPDGGPEDFDPPVYVRATPENFTTNFKSEEIRIYFNEYVKLNDAQRQIIISPPMDPKPEITPLGNPSKYIKIKITDTLQENTTYTINFGQSVVDNNAGNPLPFFKYIFSTGSYIDSLSVTGRISDAYLKETPPFISVMLYEVDSTHNDSTIFLQQPRYITNTLDSLTTFNLDYLREGTYQLIAINDLNNNYRFDPNREKIAYLNQTITVPTDSVYDLKLFKEIPKFKIERPKQVAGQHLIFGYSGIANPDSLDIAMYPVADDFEYRITKDKEKDTLHYWYKPLLERDSLNFIVNAPEYRDSLLTRRTEMLRDSLQITFMPSGSVSLTEEIQILPTTPLAETVESLITLVDQDTLDVPFSLEYNDFRNVLFLNFERKENQKFNLEALPGAFVDFFGDVNDTIRANFRTKSLSDYGNMAINLQNEKQFPIIVQLADKEGNIKAEQFSNGETSFTFSLLDPSEYFIRVIYDTNENRQWDTGNYLGKLQPEEVYYLSEPVEVRANWDVTQAVDLSYEDLSPEREPLPELEPEADQ